METYYVKRGRKYQPVSQYESGLLESLSSGTYLVNVKLGCRSVRHTVDSKLDLALLATAHSLRDHLSTKLMTAQEAQPSRPLSPRAQELWRQLQEESGDQRFMIQYPSAAQVVDEFMLELTEQTQKKLAVAAVRESWQEFCTLVDLCSTAESAA
jgi:hypothetical protein